MHPAGTVSEQYAGGGVHILRQPATPLGSVQGSSVPHEPPSGRGSHTGPAPPQHGRMQRSLGAHVAPPQPPGTPASSGMQHC